MAKADGWSAATLAFIKKASVSVGFIFLADKYLLGDLIGFYLQQMTAKDNLKVWTLISIMAVVAANIVIFLVFARVHFLTEVGQKTARKQSRKASKQQSNQSITESS